ncbi:MAG: hypothetical protein RL367_1593 [Pseudomonadota bacterium]|jgi:hypothetical protein
MPQRDFPDHIAHKPVYVVPYFDHDYSEECDRDAQFITVGWPQWGDDEPSAKIVRHSGQRWSRQSEELPLTRLVDLAILTAMVFGQGHNLTKIEPDAFESQPEPSDVAFGSKRDRIFLSEELKSDELLKRRFRKPFEILNEIAASGSFE